MEIKISAGREESRMKESREEKSAQEWYLRWYSWGPVVVCRAVCYWTLTAQQSPCPQVLKLFNTLKTEAALRILLVTGHLNWKHSQGEARNGWLTYCTKPRGSVTIGCKDLHDSHTYSCLHFLLFSSHSLKLWVNKMAMTLPWKTWVLDRFFLVITHSYFTIESLHHC